MEEEIEIEEERGLTTKQLIAKLLELDPDGNKHVYLECGDDYYSDWVYADKIEVDNDNNIVTIW